MAVQQYTMKKQGNILYTGSIVITLEVRCFAGQRNRIASTQLNRHVTTLHATHSVEFRLKIGQK